MSLILDALRKMEQERKARLGKRPDIRPEVMRNRERRGKSSARPYLMGAGALLLVAAGIFGGMSLRKEAPSAPVAEETAAPAQVQASVPEPPAAPITPAVTPPVQTLPVPPPPPPPPVAAPQEEEFSQMTANPSLNLMGIAWQEERAARKAVINGKLVGEGAVIEGARIVEIRENRVIFSQGGSRFELSLTPPLSKGSPSEKTAPAPPPLSSDE